MFVYYPFYFFKYFKIITIISMIITIKLKITNINHHRKDEPYLPLNIILQNNAILIIKDTKKINTPILRDLLNKRILRDKHDIHNKYSIILSSDIIVNLSL